MGVGNVGNVGAGVSSSRSTGSNVKEQPTVKNTTSSAAVKAASPTTAVRNDTRDTSTAARSNVQETGGKNTGQGGIAAAANVGAGVGSNSAGGGNKNNGGQTSDRVDQPAPAWLQLQDQLDALAPTSHNRGLDAIDSPGSSQQFADFMQNVQNGSLGVPRAAGYGLNYDPNSRIGFDPMAQDTAGMNASLADNGIGAAQQLHDLLQAPYNARVAANGGVAPFEGPIDTAGIVHALNAPYYRRMLNEGSDAAGGALPTPTTREVQTVPIHATTAEAKTNDWPNAWARLLDSSDRLPADTSLIAGTAPAYADSNAIGRTLNPDGSYSEPLEAIQAATADVPLPRIDPRGYPGEMPVDSSVPLNAPGGAPVSITVHGGKIDTAAADKPSTWDKVVDNTGKLLSHTGLGSIVSTIFPDLWNGMGDTFKGMDNGGGVQTKYPEDMATALAGIYGDPHSGQGGGQSAAPVQVAAAAPFPDVNHNGIDDRLEGLGGTSPPDLGGNQFRSNRQAVFPDMPPYRPGVDDEWNYFHDHLARGGVVGYSERDPRVSMIADAEDALHRGDHQHASITQFVDTFGPKALENLNNNVRAGYRMRAGRVVSGPGGPTDDAVPAVIDGQHPAKLSSGEFVIPVAAVEGIGGGDPKVGADRLQALSARFAKGGSVHKAPDDTGSNLEWGSLDDLMPVLGRANVNWRGRPESTNIEDRRAEGVQQQLDNAKQEAAWKAQSDAAYKRALEWDAEHGIKH